MMLLCARPAAMPFSHAIAPGKEIRRRRQSWLEAAHESCVRHGMTLNQVIPRISMRLDPIDATFLQA